MTSKRILTVALSLAVVSFPPAGLADEASPLPAIAFKLVPLSEGITVIENDGTTTWQLAAPSGEATVFHVRLAVVLSVRFELCEVERGACGGGEGPSLCLNGIDDDGDGRTDGLDPDCHGIQGWSLPVRAEYGWFGERSLTLRGTVADMATRPPGLRDLDGSWQKTEFAEPVRNNGYWGLISAVVLTFAGETRLYAGEHAVLIFEGYLEVPSGPARTEPLAGFRVLTPRIEELWGGSGQPVQTVVTVNGESQHVEVSSLDIEAVVIDGLGSARFIRGDSNTDGRVDIADAVTTLDVLFRFGPSLRCLDAADADADGVLGLSDVILVVRHQFLGGTPPPAPYPGCGSGVPEGLGCDAAPEACR